MNFAHYYCMEVAAIGINVTVGFESKLRDRLGGDRGAQAAVRQILMEG